MLKSFFSGAKLGIISKSDVFRYFPNEFLIKKTCFSSWDRSVPFAPVPFATDFT